MGGRAQLVRRMTGRKFADDFDGAAGFHSEVRSAINDVSAGIDSRSQCGTSSEDARNAPPFYVCGFRRTGANALNERRHVLVTREAGCNRSRPAPSDGSRDLVDRGEPWMKRDPGSLRRQCRSRCSHGGAD